MFKKVLIVLILLILSMNFVLASENVTEDVAFDEQATSSNQTHIVEEMEINLDDSSPIEENQTQTNTKIETRNVNGIDCDYLKIIYKGNDELLVPISQFSQVRKYVSSQGRD